MPDLAIVSFVPLSNEIWPGKNSAIVSVPGCNFRCGYCFSGPMVLNPDSLESIPVSDILKRLSDSKPGTNAVVITGGEPTLQGIRLMKFLEECQHLGFRTRIETNGSNPFLIKNLIEEDLIDSVVVDLKAPLYSSKYFSATQKHAVLPSIRRTMLLVENAGIDYEYRVVAIPGFHSKRDVFSICRKIQNAKRLVLHSFRTGNGTLDESFLRFSEPDYDFLLSLAQGIEKMNLGIREIRIRTDKGEETVNQIKQLKKY